MKRIIFSLLLASSLFTSARAQDAAVEERLNKLSGQIEDLLAAKAEQDKRISALAKELESLREQASKPAGNYAGQEELRKLAETVQRIDQKRVEDNEHILKEIEKLGKTVSSKPPKAATVPGGNSGEAGKAERGF